jgi:hypothetical protein
VLDDSASHGTVGVQMAVNLETNSLASLNQQLKINLSNSCKFVVNNIQVHLVLIFFTLISLYFFVLNFTLKFINYVFSLI